MKTKRIIQMRSDMSVGLSNPEAVLRNHTAVTKCVTLTQHETYRYRKPMSRGQYIYVV